VVDCIDARSLLQKDVENRFVPGRRGGMDGIPPINIARAEIWIGPVLDECHTRLRRALKSEAQQEP